jgi:type I restriction enzyme S subunit
LADLRDLVVPRHENVSLDGSFGDWSPITVHLDGQISVRDRPAPYKGAMFAVYPGDIVFSKIDARSGAIGMLPVSIPKAVVTPEFPVFVADPCKLDSGFVQRVLRTGGFLKDLRSKATGTSGRKRISPAAFLDLRIPLPEIAEQQAIVTAYETALAEAAGKERAADAAEAKAVADFETALGFAPPVPLPDRPLFIASFKDLDRWSHEAVLRRITGGAASTASWPSVRLGDVIADLENGWSPKCLPRPATSDEWGVLKLGAVSFAVYNAAENKALPSHLKPRASLEVRTGEVLISRANITRLVGATALISETRTHLLLCDKIFRMIWRKPSPVTAEFVTEVLRIGDVRRQIEGKLTGTSPTMKNISKPALLSLEFPLPPLNDQRQLVDALNNGRAEAAALRAEAAAGRAVAWRQFEASVYSADLPTPPPVANLDAAYALADGK